MIVFVLGTRPEIIKISPLVHEAGRRGLRFAIVHTGQHYTPELDEIFFRELNLPQPNFNIRVGSLPPAKQIGAMLDGLHEVFSELKPRVVLVQGDTNSVLAGALTAHKMGIKVAHLEAGLRSDDWEMPEEANRVLTGFIADYHFCPTDLQRERLAQETVREGVYVVGNTIADAVNYYANEAKKIQTPKIAGRYVLLTLHRPSNVDDPELLKAMLGAISSASKQHGLKIAFPIHPRTKAVMEKNQILLDEQFIELPSLGYLELLKLQMEADLILTDSGGIQEEACILRVPSITLRSTTERPETLRVGASVLYCEPDANILADIMKAQMEKERNWENPFGDGQTAKKVIDILSEE